MDYCGVHVDSKWNVAQCKIQDISMGMLEKCSPASLMTNHTIHCDNIGESSIHSLGDDLGWENGWVVDESSSALLFWVPPWNCVGLWWLKNTVIIVEGSMKLDCSHFVHGKYWQQCQR